MDNESFSIRYSFLSISLLLNVRLLCNLLHHSMKWANERFKKMTLFFQVKIVEYI